MRKFLVMAVTTMAALLYTSCSQDELSSETSPRHSIVASMQPAADTRTAIGSSVAGAVGILWTDGDEIGVFDASGAAQKRYAKVEAGSMGIATFAAVGTEAFTEPVYAYYPYSADNDGRDISSLAGNLPSVQNMDSGTLHGDYKYGRAKGASGEGHEFVFTHLFSMARIVIDATDTPLQGEKLKSLSITATRGGAAVAIAGSFTFNARNGSWSQSGEGENVVVQEWTDGPLLDQTVTCYASLFPNVATGDLFTIEAVTANHRATFTATSKVTFARERIYNFPVSLNKYQTIKVYDSAGNLVQDGPNAPEPVVGTFTCATLNVDGLPKKIGLITINGDGPGESGTTAIGNAVNSLGWDFMAVSEDFEYHSQLAAALSNYDAGKWRGTITSAQLTSRADTDGLGFFWKKDGITATGETMVQFTSEEGGLTSGANTCIKKGFRHYEVTVAEGITVDVYVTHMNTYSGSGNTYPTWNTKSLMIRSKFAGDTENDICCSDDQRGEVVDKIWYIDVPGAELQLKALSCENDVTNFTASTENASYSGVTVEDADGNILENQSVSYVKNVGLADHFPVVVKFEYTYTKK